MADLSWMTKIFLGLKLIKFEEKSKFLNKEIGGLSSIQRTNITLRMDKVLRMGHYLIVAHTTHLSQNIFI